VTVVGIAWRSLRQRLLSTALTALSVALGVALVVFVFQVRDLAKRAFDDAAGGYDVVVGGIQTPALTSVLSTIFHSQYPIDTVPIAAYEEIKADPRVRYAVPFAIGDVYRGSRVVGTTPEFFDAILDAAKRPLRERVKGRVFGTGGEFEAVVGATVAAKKGLRIGSEFTVTHGLEEGGHAHDDVWRVVGALEPTGTPNDRAIFITLESFFHVKGHVEEGGSEGEGKPWAVSSVVVRLKSPMLRPQFLADWRKRGDLRPASPVDEVGHLFALVENVDRLFKAVAWLVLVVSGVAILVGLWNSMEGRRREIAILRALGARPAHVFSVVVLEAVILCLLGGVAGLVLGHGAVAAAAPALLEDYGIRIAPQVGMGDVWALLGLVGMGGLVGLLPAWRAFRVPVAQNLHPVD
jgi:putative ABC transport system permease protein